ncbi:MAG TPA: methyltransferase domain-containing protein [Acidimicrobiales bacterium]
MDDPGDTAKTGDTYTHGHHESVLRSHKWRTAQNSAGYLLDHLRPGHDLLDVGCGPGTITLDLAERLAPGRVVGIDRAGSVLEDAKALRRERRAANVTFTTGDAYALEFDDRSFDVVHAHQVLQHLSDPGAALAEMRRVLRRDGILAVRDSDYGSFLWSPEDPLLSRWLELYHQVTARNGAEADAGRRLLGWVRAAGFDDARLTTSTWTFADHETTGWWSELWAERITRSAFAEQAVAYSLTDAGELERLAAAWQRWGRSPDAVFVLVHFEVLAGPPG